jgi:hypothetical protein
VASKSAWAGVASLAGPPRVIKHLTPGPLARGREVARRIFSCKLSTTTRRWESLAAVPENSSLLAAASSLPPRTQHRIRCLPLALHVTTTPQTHTCHGPRAIRTPLDLDWQRGGASHQGPSETPGLSFQPIPSTTHVSEAGSSLHVLHTALCHRLPGGMASIRGGLTVPSF